LKEDYCHMRALFGPFTIDLFATSDNAKCLRFYSRLFEEGALGVDSFAQKWAGERAFAAPPVSLVIRTIRKAAVTEMGGILLVPLWKGAKFWTWAFRDGRHLNGMFANLQLICMKALAWEISTKGSEEAISRSWCWA
jgi:hypothetical protein